MGERISPLGQAAVAGAMIGFLALVVYSAAGFIRGHETRPISGAIRFTPTPDYRLWYEKTAQCAQLPNLDYSKIEWYVIPDVVSFPTDIGEKVALWEQLSDGYSRITIADYYLHNEMVVRHEMLHDMLGRFGRPTGHPALYFEDRCQLTWSTWQGAK